MTKRAPGDKYRVRGCTDPLLPLDLDLCTEVIVEEDGPEGEYFIVMSFMPCISDSVILPPIQSYEAFVLFLKNVCVFLTLKLRRYELTNLEY